MKVILVDDEKMAIEHLLNLIPWDAHGFEVIATATNGKSALKLFDEHHPQVMIVDIRMPVMDGLELIRTVAAKSRNVKFIITSAYRDFDYAQQAIEFGVSSYIVKHVMTRDKLLEELDKTKQAWEAEEERRRIFYQKQFKNMVMLGTTADKYLKEELAGQWAFALLQLDMPFCFNQALVPPNVTEIDRLGDEKVHSFQNEGIWNFRGSFPVSETQYSFIYTTTNNSMRLLWQSLRETAQRLQNRYSINGTSFSAFYSIHHAGFDSLGITLTKIKTAARYSIFCGKQALLCTDELPVPTSQENLSDVTIGASWETLVASLERRDPNGIKPAIEDLFRTVQYPYWNIQRLYQSIESLHKLFNTFRRKEGLPNLTFFENIDEAFYDLNAIRDRLIEWFTEAVSATTFTGRHIPPKLMKALRYIHHHYQEEFSIDTLSDDLGISSSYLHFLFKRELGCTFLEYLTDYRVAQAKYILEREDVKMSEVALRVGYRSTPYFSQVFKRITGLLPRQYRERAETL